MRLYVGDRSGNCHKVQLFLSVLETPYEEVRMTYDDRSLKSADFLAKNPRGQVPVLEHEGRYVWDSQAILVYLARRFGGERWLPLDAFGMAEVMQWLALSENEMLYGIARARAIRTFREEGDHARAVAIAHRGLAVLERRLEESDWLALGRPTIAEMACFTYPALAHEGDIDVGAYRSVVAWLGRVRALPGFVAMPGM